MKTIFRILFLTTLLSALYACDDDRHIDYQYLPEPIHLFINTYFNNTEVIKSEQHDNSYYLLLNNNFMLTFTAQGAWQEVNGNLQPLPSPLQIDILPINLRNYVATQYPNADIIAAKRNATQYHITLNTAPLTQLTFDNEGNIVN